MSKQVAGSDDSHESDWHVACWSPPAFVKHRNCMRWILAGPRVTAAALKDADVDVVQRHVEHRHSPLLYSCVQLAHVQLAHVMDDLLSSDASISWGNTTCPLIQFGTADETRVVVCSTDPTWVRDEAPVQQNGLSY